MNSIEVRRARPEDVASIYSIQTECRLSPWPRSAYEAEVTRKNAIVLVAPNDVGDAAGFITGRVIPGDKESQMHAEIYNLGVSSSFRLQGIGSALLQVFIETCKDCGVCEVFLEVRQSNLPAIAFYRSSGFRKAGERKNFYTDPEENAEIMTISLDDSAARNK